MGYVEKRNALVFGCHDDFFGAIHVHDCWECTTGSFPCVLESLGLQQAEGSVIYQEIPTCIEYRIQITSKHAVPDRTETQFYHASPKDALSGAKQGMIPQVLHSHRRPNRYKGFKSNVI